MLAIARRCVPFTPFEKELSTAIVTLVSATGVHLPDQQPFPEEDPGDVTYRVIPGSAEVSSLLLKHHHYDHSEADTDPNIVFPLATLQELAAEGFIAAVNDYHYSYGFTTRLKELYENTFPSIANMAREIESRGVPTLILSASPAATQSVRPPRGMTFEGSAVGRIVGRAGDREFHKKVIKAALEMFTHDTPPGKVITKPIH